VCSPAYMYIYVINAEKRILKYILRIGTNGYLPTTTGYYCEIIINRNRIYICRTAARPYNIIYRLVDHSFCRPFVMRLMMARVLSRHRHRRIRRCCLPLLFLLLLLLLLVLYYIIIRIVSPRGNRSTILVRRYYCTRGHFARQRSIARDTLQPIIIIV